MTAGLPGNGRDGGIPDDGRRERLRWVPVAVLAALAVLILALGGPGWLSFKTIGLHYQEIKSYVAAWPLLAVLTYLLAYLAVSMLALPGGAALSVTGGLLFGWWLGAIATLIGATIGATVLFLVVTSSFGTVLAARAGPFVAKLRDGFRSNALSYLLFLRLVPLFPFFAVNLVPALLGVPLRTFVIGTLIGIIPGTLAFSLAGSGLGSVLEAQNAAWRACAAANPSAADTACPYVVDLKSLVTPEIILAGAALGIVALIPVAFKLWSKRHAAA